MEAYRLRPDRRFLWAVADVHLFLTGQERREVVVTFREGLWHVRYRGGDVGAVPEFPDFGDFVRLLTDWVGRLDAARPLGLAADGGAASRLAEVDRALDRFLAPHAMAALGRLEELWRAGSRDPGLLPRATRALTLLTLQGLDAAEVGDALPARAIALLALAKGLTRAPMVREASLLAEITEYGAHAREVAASLPPGDPVRLYVFGEDGRLEELARGSSGGAEARYLWLLRLARRRDEQLWADWYQSHFRHEDVLLPALAAGLRLDRFGTNETLGAALPSVVYRELLEHGAVRDGGGLSKARRAARRFWAEVRPLAGRVLPRWFRVSSVAEEVESELGGVARAHRAPFWDAETVRAYYRRHLYSAAYTLGLHYLDDLSAIPAVQRFAGDLGEPREGIAADFRRWYGDLADSKAGRPASPRLLEDLDRLPTLGARPLMRSFREVTARLRLGTPQVYVGARRLVSRMDSRMSHRVHLGRLAHTALLDLRLAERVYGSVAATAPVHYPGAHAWYLKLTGQHERLDGLLQSDAWPPETRADILGRLGDRLEPELLRRGYERLMADAPDSWAVRSKYVDHLERTKRYDDAVSVIRGWLERHDRSAGFDYIGARTALARMHYLAGRYAEGWEAVAEVVESQQAGAMGRAALLLERLERTGEAEELGQALVERYPDFVWARRVLAELYWRRGRHEDAARVLTASPHRIGVEDWHWTIGPAFEEVFARRPPRDGLAAFAALVGQGIGPTELGEIVTVLSRAGHHELAFSLGSSLRGFGLEDLMFRVGGYRSLRAWKGESEALDWLRKQIPVRLFDAWSTVAYDQEEFDLVWELAGDPGRGEHADFVWLMRAAAWVRQGARDDVRRRALADHYLDPAPGHYHALGRFLLGLETEPAVLALATDPKKRCEIAYYVGLRAQAERRYADASDWYRVTLETGQERNGEYRWAFSALNRWEQAGKSLARLAAEAS